MDIESASHDNHDTSSNSSTKRKREQDKVADAINDEEGNASKRTSSGKSVPNDNLELFDLC